ncbi:CbiX/SirB N-terminal domain-containing protein [Aneurinibacillus sp. Ricciae_BoGa-3]|uniref:sirohydrochlorin chelatase n=1 Tax=Aneurinibacillus sp. Ricciae_BoGa-3 TaxID=3022697 RepID=UPI0023427832|nr:CbiX/SirB N-terminal domain-containing protein [Aneurinibacillus sp. Ricciae_BoGa-3]WCK55110.1 CbiX/SirB N-terminal domain-containing protein [Aneurinibacillus sp. Ricciae_BoGa-3]
MGAGVLVICHGSRNAGWVQYIEQLKSELHIDTPVAFAFLEMADGEGIYDGIRSLEGQGVDRIIAVPLFVSTGSTHLDEIQYALRILAKPSVDTDLKPLPLSVPVHWTRPMDDHPLILDILRERIKRLSLSAGQEVLMVAAHGSDVPGFQEKWQHVLGRITSHLHREFGFKGAVYATIHPDTIRAQALAAADKGRLLVIPLFLSEGYYTKKAIPAKLAGIPHLYSGEAYLPDERIARWIEETAAPYIQK